MRMVLFPVPPMPVVANQGEDARDGTASSDLELYVTASGGQAQGWRAVVLAPSTGRVESWRLVGSSWSRMRP